MKVFGCSCYPYLRPYNHHKLQFRSGKCVFLGYSSLHKGYQCLHPSGRVYISNHVIFDESSFPFKSAENFSAKSYYNSLQESGSSNPFVSFTLSQTAAQLDRSPSQSTPSATDSASNSHLFSSENQPLSHIPSPIYHHSPSQPIHHLSPPSQSTDGHPMLTRSKMGIFKPKKAYLVQCDPKSTEPLTVSAALKDPKWLQAMKEEYHALPTYPVKVVGNKWVFRIKHNADGSISRFKARLVAKGFHQTQEVYMQQPEGFVDPSKPTHIFYVDDIIVTGSNSAQIQQVIINLQTTFALKDLGELHFFLGIQVTKTDTGLHLSQSKYIADLLTKKQGVVSRSSTESEYRALAMAASEVLWLKSLLTEIGISLVSTPVIWCDNQSAAALASNPKFHSRTKHIELDVHFLREKVANQNFQISYVPSSHNSADILTKALAYHPFHYLRDKLTLTSLG
ncbi:retrovirus-related pol polyprotein from transposon RE1 [Citrus sinensis]|nr:retrovirus-related pol polyprotein from transposon RE1 [Citrus sinensis]